MGALADAALRNRGFDLPRAIELPCVALCVAQLTFFAFSYLHGNWLVQPDGTLVANDFVNVWAAGQQVLHGHAAEAYDPKLHKLMEDAAVGHHFSGEYPWNYPPAFLIVAAALGAVSLLAANFVFLLLTFPLYIAALRAIIPHRAALLFACAFPGIVANVGAVQNGFLSAALIGGALVLLERRPVLAGVLIGCLTFKPHLGLLFPLVLVIGGHWRTIGAAAATTVALALVACVAFGPDIWAAFVHALPATSEAALTQGRADFAKLQSLYAVVRMLGGGEHLGWTLHGIFGVLIALTVGIVWRSRVAYELKAAALSTGALLATPYLFMYDLAALAVPLAFLVRASIAADDLPRELLRIVPVCVLLVAFLAMKSPVGFAATLLVAGLVARRVALSGLPSPVLCWPWARYRPSLPRS